MPRFENGYDVKLHINPDVHVIQDDALGGLGKGKKAPMAMELIAVGHLVVRALPRSDIKKIISRLQAMENGGSLPEAEPEIVETEHLAVRMAGVANAFDD